MVKQIDSVSCETPIDPIVLPNPYFLRIMDIVQRIRTH